MGYLSFTPLATAERATIKGREGGLDGKAFPQRKIITV